VNPVFGRWVTLLLKTTYSKNVFRTSSTMVLKIKKMKLNQTPNDCETEYRSSKYRLIKSGPTVLTFLFADQQIGNAETK
jgi:hypothetical protein